MICHEGHLWRQMWLEPWKISICSREPFQLHVLGLRNHGWTAEYRPVFHGRYYSFGLIFLQKEKGSFPKISEPQTCIFNTRHQRHNVGKSSDASFCHHDYSTITVSCWASDLLIFPGPQTLSYKWKWESAPAFLLQPSLPLLFYTDDSCDCLNNTSLL